MFFSYGLSLKHWINSGLSNSIGGRLHDSKSHSSKAIEDEDWSMVVFITVSDPSIKVLIKEYRTTSISIT